MMGSIRNPSYEDLNSVLVSGVSGLMERFARG
jgi:hypothetical protein